MRARRQLLAVVLPARGRICAGIGALACLPVLRRSWIQVGLLLDALPLLLVLPLMGCGDGTSAVARAQPDVSLDLSTGDVPSWDSLPWPGGVTPAADATTVAGGQGLPCGGATAKSDGTCCPAGEGYDPQLASCVASALPECDAGPPCKPVWCADWKDAAGLACSAGTDTCAPTPRICTASEIAATSTCRAGQWPWSDGCAPAGARTESPDGKVLPTLVNLPAVASPTAQIPAGAPTTALPPWQDIPLQHCYFPLQAKMLCATSPAPCPTGTTLLAGQCAPPLGQPDACPPGFLPSVGAMACAPDPADCVTDPLTDPPPTAGPTLFVDAAHVGPADGTAIAPFASLEAALAVAATDTTLVLAPGSYPWPMLPIGVNVRGRCAAQVAVLVPDEVTAVALSGSLNHLTLQMNHAVLALSDQAQLDHVWLQSAATEAVVGAQVKVVDSVVDAKHNGLTLQGNQNYLSHVRVLGQAGIGVQVLGASELTHVTVSGFDTGVLVQSAAALQQARLIGNHLYGLQITGPSASVQMSGMTVSATGPATKAEPDAAAMQIALGAHVNVDGQLQLIDNDTIGLLLQGGGTQLTGGALLVAASQPVAQPLGGAGLVVHSGAAATIAQVSVVGARGEGVRVAHPTSMLSVERLLVAATAVRAATGTDGFGLHVSGGATAQVGRLRASGNHAAGLWLEDAGSRLMGQHCAVDDTLPQADGWGGRGVQVTGGAHFLLSGTLAVMGNRDHGLRLDGAGTLVQVGAPQSPFAITKTAPRADGGTGRGVTVTGGAQLILQHGVIGHNHEAGLVVAEAGSLAQLAHVVVMGTQPRTVDQRLGRGIVVENAGTLQGTQLIVAGNRDAGIEVHGGTLTGSDWLVSDTQASPQTDNGPGRFGRGIVAQGQSNVALDHVRLTRNAEVGLSVARAEVAVRHLIIDATQPRLVDGQLGRAVDASLEAQVRIVHGVLAANADTSAMAADAGTTLQLRDVAIRGVEGKSVGRPAVFASDKADLQWIGGSVNGHGLAGVAGDFATILLAGVAIADTLAGPAGDLGVGVSLRSSVSQLFGVAIQGVRGAGLLVRNGQATVQRMAIEDTAAAAQTDGAMLAGDGVQIVEDAAVQLRDLRATSNQRAGVVVHAAILQAVRVLLGNNLIGWAIQAGGDLSTQGAIVATTQFGAWTGQALPILPPPTAPARASQLEPMTY